MAKIKDYVLPSGTTIRIGRDAEGNDELVREAKPNETLVHTVAPGSPFVNVGENPSKNDLDEAAVFCAKCSQDWRDNHRAIDVNIFKKKDMNKSPKMKVGTWSVKKQDKIKVKKAEILKVGERLNEAD